MAVSVGVAVIDHRPAASHHPCARVFALALYVGYCTTVSVLAVLPDSGLLVVAQASQCLPRLLAVGLALFWCVYGGDADFDLLVSTWFTTAGCEGVAVCDGDNEAEGSMEYQVRSCARVSGNRNGHRYSYSSCRLNQIRTWY